MNTQRILLVEDEASIAETVEFALKREGMSVSWVATAQEARQIFRKEAFHAVVLDVGFLTAPVSSYARKSEEQAIFHCCF